MSERFIYARPTQEQILLIAGLREKCRELEEYIINHVPPSREMSLAITKLEEVSMWGNKAIVFKDAREEGNDR